MSFQPQDIETNARQLIASVREVAQAAQGSGRNASSLDNALITRKQAKKKASECLKRTNHEHFGHFTDCTSFGYHSHPARLVERPVHSHQGCVRDAEGDCGARPGELAGALHLM